MIRVCARWWMRVCCETEKFTPFSIHAPRFICVLRVGWVESSMLARGYKVRPVLAFECEYKTAIYQDPVCLPFGYFVCRCHVASGCPFVCAAQPHFFFLSRNLNLSTFCIRCLIALHRAFFPSLSVIRMINAKGRKAFQPKAKNGETGAGVEMGQEKKLKLNASKKHWHRTKETVTECPSFFEMIFFSFFGLLREHFKRELVSSLAHFTECQSRRQRATAMRPIGDTTLI